MLAPDATLIALRESLEAFLILSILAGMAVKFGRPEARRPLLAGALAAVALSVVAGVAIDALARDFFETSGSAELFEGVATLVAVVILTYMVVWMYRHTVTLVGELHQRARAAFAVGASGVLFTLAFVAVAREGLETVLFYATLASSTPASDLLLSAIVGIGASAIVAALVFTGIVRLDFQKFFAITGLLLVVFAGGLLATTIHEFAEVGILPETPHAWNTESILDQHSTTGSLVKAVFGYRESPTYAEAGAYFLYVLALGTWYMRGIRLALKRVTTTPTDA